MRAHGVYCSSERGGDAVGWGLHQLIMPPSMHPSTRKHSLADASQLVQEVKAMAQADDVQEGDSAVLQFIAGLQ
eukprot:1141470-Pelagomonas_calceolata.AAC.2